MRSKILQKLEDEKWQKAKQILKDFLVNCTESQQMLFKRMYAFKNIDLSINECVDIMEIENIDQALSQCEKTSQNSEIAKQSYGIFALCKLFENSNTL